MTAGVTTVLSWSTADIDDTAGRLRGWSGDVDWLAVDFTSRSDIGDLWRGAAGSAAEAQAVRVAGDVQTLAAILDDTAAAVRAANARLSEAQTRLAAARIAGAAIGCPLTEDAVAVVPVFVGAHTDDPIAHARELTTYGLRVLDAQLISGRAQQALADAVRAEREVATALTASLSMPRRTSRGWALDESHLLLDGRRDPSVQAALDALRELSNRPYDDADRLRRLADLLHGMSPDQIEQFFANCTDADTANLDAFLAQRQDSGGWPWSRWHEGLSDEARRSLLNHLLEGLDADTLRDLRARLHSLETDAFLKDYYKNDPGRAPLTWVDLTAPLFHRTGEPIDASIDVNQGGDGDCWFLTSLNAVARQHPELLVRHLHPNANGTVTVEFFVHGHWVNVTVLPDVPHEGNNPAPSYAAQGKNGDQVSWVAIYEKAYAQLRHGYEGINGGHPHDALANILGPDAEVHSTSTGDADMADLERKLHAGAAIAANTHQPGGGGGDKEFLDPAKSIAGSHSYAVVAINDKAGTIRVRNPWGVNSGTPVEVTLSFAEFRRYFSGIDYAEIK